MTRPPEALEAVSGDCKLCFNIQVTGFYING